MQRIPFLVGGWARTRNPGPQRLCLLAPSVASGPERRFSDRYGLPRFHAGRASPSGNDGAARHGPRPHARGPVPGLSHAPVPPFPRRRHGGPGTSAYERNAPYQVPAGRRAFPSGRCHPRSRLQTVDQEDPHGHGAASQGGVGPKSRSGHPPAANLTIRTLPSSPPSQHARPTTIRAL